MITKVNQTNMGCRQVFRMKKTTRSLFCYIVLVLICGGGVAYADYAWDAGVSGRITDSHWNNGGASPFNANFATTANAGIILNSGTITTGGMILHTNAGNLGGEEQGYANRTVFRLKGGTLQFESAATNFTINQGSGFIQEGGTLSINASNLVLSIYGTMVQNVISSGTLNISELKLNSGNSNLQLGANATLQKLSLENGSRLVITGTTQVNAGNNHPNLMGTVQVQAGGTLNFNNTFNIQGGTFLVDEGHVSTLGNLNVANSAQGTSLEITSGDITAANIRVGNLDGSNGTMTISGGTVKTTGRGWETTDGFHVGNAGTGKLGMTGGTVDTRYFTVGNTGSGTLELSQSSTGESGTLKIANSLYLGRSGGGHGTFTLSAGKVDIGQHLVIGQNGTGTMVQNGGSVQIGLEGGNFKEFYVGRSANSSGSYTLNDGNVQVAGDIYWGNQGEADVTLNGGTVHVANNLYAGYANKATVIMNEGTLNVDGRVYMNSAAEEATTGSVEWTVNGGTLDAKRGLSICNATLNITGGEVISGSGTELAFNKPNALIHISGGKLTVNQKIIFHQPATGSAVRVSGGELVVTGNYEVATATMQLDVHNEQFGKVTIQGAASFGNNNNQVLLSSAGVMSIAESSHDLLSIGGGNLDSFTITDHSEIWNATKDGRKITLSLVEPVDSYSVDSGWLQLEEGRNAGVIALNESTDPYQLILSLEGVTDTDDFLGWLDENRSLEMTSLGESQWKLGLFAANLPTYFAWDFSSYAGGNVTLTGLTGQSVPEPGTWGLLLLALGLLGSRKYGLLRKFWG